jgi:hypothetical protein
MDSVEYTTVGLTIIELLYLTIFPYLVSMWKNNTNLINWGVERKDVESTVNYIKTQYDSEKASFLLSRMVSVDQIVLERQLLTIAHAHTNDRANAYATNILFCFVQSS